MTSTRAFLLALAFAASPVVHAQWQWLDGAGRKVYSDQPPPPEVPQRSILRQPGARAASTTIPPAAAPAPASPAAAASAPSGRDRDLEARRKQAEAADAQKKKAEDERVAKQRADNCQRARSARATLDSGVRLMRRNDKGEQEFLDDAGRAEEARRLDAIVASECANS